MYVEMEFKTMTFSIENSLQMGSQVYPDRGNSMIAGNNRYMKLLIDARYTLTNLSCCIVACGS